MKCVIVEGCVTKYHDKIIKYKGSDVSMLINLTELDCNNTKISDVSMLVNLIKLDCNNTKISDVSMLTKLTKLDCDGNVKR